MLSIEEFRFIAKQIRPHTRYIYLHVLGEPLLHPDIEQLLQIAHEEDLFVNLTTNGSLLIKKQNALLAFPPRQINISLHDWEENLPLHELNDRLTETLQLAERLAETTYTSFRLWNRAGNAPQPFNKTCADLLSDRYGLSSSELLHTLGNTKLAPHIFLQNERRFNWPSDKNEVIKTRTCYALKTHIAILSDGTVVPCCIDANADLRLGNIFEQPLSDILQSERAQRIREGFRQKLAVEPFCQRCGFLTATQQEAQG